MKINTDYFTNASMKLALENSKTKFKDIESILLNDSLSDKIKNDEIHKCINRSKSRSDRLIVTNKCDNAIHHLSSIYDEIFNLSVHTRKFKTKMLNANEPFNVIVQHAMSSYIKLATFAINSTAVNFQRYLSQDKHEYFSETNFIMLLAKDYTKHHILSYIDECNSLKADQYRYGVDNVPEHDISRVKELELFIQALKDMPSAHELTLGNLLYNGLLESGIIEFDNKYDNDKKRSINIVNLSEGAMNVLNLFVNSNTKLPSLVPVEDIQEFYHENEHASLYGPKPSYKISDGCLRAVTRLQNTPFTIDKDTVSYHFNTENFDKLFDDYPEYHKIRGCEDMKEYLDGFESYQKISQVHEYQKTMLYFSTVLDMLEIGRIFSGRTIYAKFFID